MSVFKKSIYSTWSWTKFFLIFVVVKTAFAFSDGGVAVGEALFSTLGAAIFFSFVIFVVYFIKHLIQQKK